MEFKKLSWEIFDKYLKSDSYITTRHHLNSYDEFLTSKIVATIKRNNPIAIVKEFNKSIEKYTYEIEVYIGGLVGEDIYIDRPVIYDSETKSYKQLYPNEARLKNMTYACNLYADIVIKYTHNNGKITKHYETRFEGDQKVCIGKIPIMLHSKYCILRDMPHQVLEEMGEDPDDRGGYFIIDGKEKSIISQERRAVNIMILEELKNDEVFSHSNTVKSVLEYSFVQPQNFIIKIRRDNQKIYAQVPYLREDIPIFILFRALGVVSDKEIIEYIFYTSINNKLINLLIPTIEDSGPVYSQKDALQFLASYKMKEQHNIAYLYYIFDKYLLPHVNFKDDENNDYFDTNKIKCFHIGMMINKLLKLYTNQIEPTDKDSFSNKRIETSGSLLAELFSDSYDNYKNNTVEKMISSEYEFKIKNNQTNITCIDQLITNENKGKIFNQNIIENIFLRSMKGNWGSGNNSKKRIGIVQDLQRRSFFDKISNIRRLHLPLPAGSKVVPPRKLHSSQWGMCCPNETPDGGNIGVIKSLAITAYITAGERSNSLFEVLMKCSVYNIDSLNPSDIFNQTKVIINGRWIGVHFEPDKLCQQLLLLRRNNLINRFTSISWNIKDMEININTDDGRLVRPLIIIDNRDNLSQTINWNNIKSKSWEQLIINQKDASLDDFLSGKTQLSNSIIEYVDNTEIDHNILIATHLNYINPQNCKVKKYTHSEIHPSVILGVLGFSIPFSPHNASPRNLFSIGHSKQAIGIYTSNYQNRMDQTGSILHYPQKSICHSRLMNYLGPLSNCNGQNSIVAIASYTGYNQEDSIIMNKSSLERGLFTHTTYKTFVDEIVTSKDHNNEIFTNPTLYETIVKKGLNYSKLNKFGIVNEGEIITGDDVIIGKVMISKDDKGNDVFYDKSILPDKYGHFIVDKTFIIKDNDHIIYKVTLRSIKIPEIGDKFASRHGQKGVIGLLLPSYDMPYTKEGLVPDLIINPHAIPSRMTIGHLIETIFSRNGVLDAKFIDSTPFTTESYPLDQMEKLFSFEVTNYLDKHADEILYNGFNGKQLKCKIFMGPVYYMRLKQLVKDKIHSRGKGQVSLTTKQPTEGRARDGGLRIGEMERDCLLAHGVSAFMNESFTTRSDNYQICINRCNGLIQPYNYTNKDNSSEKGYSILKVPYCFKLLLQELQTMNIVLRAISE